MKDFNIAKYLKEHNLGSYGILNHYVDLKPLKEEEVAEGVITIKDTGAVTDRGDVYTRILKWMYSSFGPAKGQYDVQKKSGNIIINTGKLSKDDIAELNDFLDEYIRGGDIDEDVTPEEIAEIPYEGPDDKLDGFGDEFDQAETVSEEDFGMDMDHHPTDRMMGLAHKDLLRVGGIVSYSIESLREEGFSDQEILDFLASL